MARGAFIQHWSAMRYRITIEADYLRAELLALESREEIRTFLHAVFSASVEYLHGLVLIDVRSEKPLFSEGSEEIEKAFPHMGRITWYQSNKIAIIGNALAPGVSDTRIGRRARLQGINLCGFSNEEEALRWLHDRRRCERRDAARRASVEHSPGGKTAAPARLVNDRRQRRDQRQASRRINLEGFHPTFA